MNKTSLLVGTSLVSLALASPAFARDGISIVGSSTVFPFATVVAERFGRTTDFPTPKIESTGSGGGLKLFCSGIGVSTPDITNASRRIKASELEMCEKNGVTNVVEVLIGFDGIAIANSLETDQLDISVGNLFLALAKNVPNPDGEGLVPNPYQMWSEIDDSLPASAIEVLGPPPTSGTRDAFVELVMEKGCESFEAIEALDDDAKLYFYVKGQHVGTVPGIAEYLAEFTSENAAGEFGYLADKGMIPLSDAERAEVAAAAIELKSVQLN